MSRKLPKIDFMETLKWFKVETWEPQHGEMSIKMKSVSVIRDKKDCFGSTCELAKEIWLNENGNIITMVFPDGFETSKPFSGRVIWPKKAEDGE